MLTDRFSASATSCRNRAAVLHWTRQRFGSLSGARSRTGLPSTPHRSGKYPRCRRSCRSARIGSSRLQMVSRTAAGRARLSGRIRGDEITDLQRFVFVPEDWERAERNAQTIATVVQGAGVDRGRDGDRGDDCRHRVLEPRQFSVRTLSGGFRGLPESVCDLADQQLPCVAGLAADVAAAAIQLAVLIGSSGGLWWRRRHWD